MTKKDYILIAQSMSLVRERYISEQCGGKVIPTGYTHALNDTAVELARQLGWDNPRFNRVRFLTACGIEQG